jgi:photosystem II stability/assembly factor-like uncharacterized protein
VGDADSEVLLAGLTRDGVARSTDYAQTWQLASDGLSARLLVDLTCAPDGSLRMADLQGGTLCSTDGGRTWVEVADTPSRQPPVLPEITVTGDDSLRVTSVASGPHATRFAATNKGVYVSRDAGQTFKAWNDGLKPHAIVSVACAAEGWVYALAVGGSVWRRLD